MMRTEAKGTRSTARSLSKSYLAYALILGFFLVLLTYFMVSTQFSTYSPDAFAGPSPMSREDTSPVKHERSPLQQEEESSHEEVIEEHEKPSTTTREDKYDNNERKQESWEEKDRKEETRGDLTPFKFEESQKEEDVTQTEKEGKKDDWRERNPIEEPFGNERNSDSWQENNQWQQKDTVEFTEFGGGTDDFNHVAETKPICDTSFGKYDTCDLTGDARAIGGADATVMLVSPRAPPREWKIKPYSRKYLDGLKEVTVKSLNKPHDAPQCTTRLNVAAMVIELGGLTGNYWHDFTDVLIPLFIGARKFNGEVQFLVVNLLSFWVDKYKRIFKQLSRYDIIDFEKDYSVRCYPHVIVGYGSHKEFTIDRSQDPNGYTMVDFTKFIRTSYALGRDYPIKLGDNPGKKPRMMILERTNSRKFVNLHEVVRAAENVGFDVMVIGRTDVSYDDFTRIVNSFDVMLGVHGAGLTNCLFLPTNAVLIQIVPYGKIEHIAQTDFGQPADDMQLKYIEYSISAEESSLMDIFGRDHPMIKDPIAIHQSGWGKVAEWYLGKQDVRINIERFKPVLMQAMEYLQ